VSLLAPCRAEAVRPPDVLALDFDGVLCEGAAEYFESSRRAFARIWPDMAGLADEVFPRFRDLRPVIESGWEMPLLLKAIARGQPEALVRVAWPTVRDLLLAEGPGTRDVLVAHLRTTLDDVRREWIAGDAAGWLARHRPYCALAALARVIAAPGRAVIVTTKEGEFVRRIVDHWNLRLDSIQGKETGSHKCDNLRVLARDHAAARGSPPRLWFVEDRLETLRCVTTHGDLDAVELFLAAWGYNTPETREAVRRDERIRLLTLERFTGDFGAWHAAGDGCAHAR
jgi:hypothetical protein